jgi:hypothetical protein
MLVLTASNSVKISPNSVLEWIEGCFKNDGIDLKNESQIDFNDFSVKVHKDFTDKSTDDTLSKTYTMKLRSMIDELEGISMGTVSTSEYMAPLKSEIKDRYFSATMIMTYLRDPNEYYNRYHLGFFEGDYEIFVAEQRPEDYGMILGKLVHRILEKWNSAFEEFDQIMHILFMEYEILDHSLQNQFKNEVLSILKKLESSKLAADLLNTEEYRNEISITLRMDNDYLTGTLDRLIKNKYGIWEVIDYKTNRMENQTPAQYADHYEWQIKTYALLLSRLFPFQKQYPVTLYFVRSDQFYTKSFNSAEIERIYFDFQKILNEIKLNMPLTIDNKGQLM